LQSLAARLIPRIQACGLVETIDVRELIDCAARCDQCFLDLYVGSLTVDCSYEVGSALILCGVMPLREAAQS